MYTFTLHFDHHSSASNDTLPEQTKSFEAIDERQATAMAHLEIQTMAPLSKIVDSKIVTYRPRMIKLALPSDYPPVVAALAKEIEVDPVVEELKKKARQIYLEKHGYLPGEKPEKKVTLFDDPSSLHAYESTGMLHIGYLQSEGFTIGYVQQAIGQFTIKTSSPLHKDCKYNPEAVMAKIMHSMGMRPSELYEEITDRCDLNNMEDAAYSLLREYAPSDLYDTFPITDASRETMEDLMESAANYGCTLDPFRFFLHDVKSKRINMPQKQAN